MRHLHTDLPDNKVTTYLLKETTFMQQQYKSVVPVKHTAANE